MILTKLLSLSDKINDEPVYGWFWEGSDGGRRRGTGAPKQRSAEAQEYRV